ncbi:MAG: 16S rRNA processing protein RimM [Chlorobi bacterium]|nr:16S rRNA processing protein RimM [Chlorobiota bacterium]
MKMEDLYYLGKIVRPYGRKGEVLVKLDTDEPELYEGLESVFLEIKGQPVPFFITDSRLHKSMLLRMALEDVNSIEEAEELVGRKLFLPLSTLPPLTGNKFYYHEIMGFEAVDRDHGSLGVIKDVNDAAAQPYFIIQHPSGKEILVPIHDDFLLQVDRENKKIHLRTPEGLVKLFLEQPLPKRGK